MNRLTAAERRNRIIRAALRQFSQRGFRGTTTRELARAAGISEALLFRHFPTKRRLYQAILETRMREQLPHFFAGISATSKAGLGQLALRVGKANEADPTFMRLLLYAALEGHELSDLFFQRRTLPLLEFVKQHLRSLPHCRIRDIDLSARLFLAMLFGFLQMRLLFRIPYVRRISLDHAIAEMVQIYLGGVRR